MFELFDTLDVNNSGTRQRTMQLPKEISPNPILSATVEIRFKSSLRDDNVLNFFYKYFQEYFPTIKNIALPFDIKQLSPHLKYVGDFMLSNEKFSIRIGSSVIAFENVGADYQLWGSYFSLIKSTLQKISHLKFIEEIERVGCRYVSVFEDRKYIKELFNLNIDFNYVGYLLASQSYAVNIEKNDIRTTLRIMEDSETKKYDIVKKGVSIDIDSHQFKNLPNAIDNYLYDIIDNLHSEEKNLFYSLIRKDYLDKNLNPQY